MRKTILPLLIASALFVGKVEAQTPQSGPPFSNQGPYISWNNLTGGTGETDFVNNSGYGGGGFVFMNTPASGSPVISLMRLDGGGNLGIGTSNPISRLTLAGSNTQNPNNSGSAIDYDGEALTFVNNSGGFNLGGIRMVQKGGYYLDNGDMVFSITRTNRTTLDAITIQGATGNFGIGTTSPTAPLEINGNVKLTSGSGASIAFADNTTQSTAWTGVLTGGDYAESVNVSGVRNEYEPGDVLVIDPVSEGKFLKSSKPYSTTVTGIYSTKPGVVGRRQHTPQEHMKEEVPMAMTGIVPTKVSTENGPIKAGDLLVTSSKSGYAMKGTNHRRMLGAVIGKAIGHLDAGTSVIEAVVTLQ